MATQENILTLEPINEQNDDEQFRSDVFADESRVTVVAEPFTDTQAPESHGADSPKEVPSDDGYVISGSMTVSPRGLYNVNEPGFVPDGFQESRCPETRGLKVTEENKERLSNLEFLRKRHSEGWATEKGITYTCEMTGCEPTDSELLSLSLEGLNFRGRVVTNEGAVLDFDSERELNENATPANMEFNLRMFMMRNAHLQHDKQQTLGELADQYRVAKAREVPGDPSYCIQEPNGHVRQVPPAGIYERHEHKGKENADGIPIFTICDTPEDCCAMNHLVIGMASTGALPTEIQEQIMNYFRIDRCIVILTMFMDTLISAITASSGGVVLLNEYKIQ